MEKNKVVYFFWGHTGNGTTTSLVKYADLNCKRKDKNKAIFLTNNDFVIGAKFKLKIFAEIAEFNYQFLPLNADLNQIKKLMVYDKLFFDLHTGKQTADFKTITAYYRNYFQIKKIFVFNALLLPYTNLVAYLSAFQADEIILTFTDYFLDISEFKKRELNRKIRILSNSMLVWISDGPMIPENLYKFNK